MDDGFVMRRIIIVLISIFCFVSGAAAQDASGHSVTASWSYFGFNSTYSKNSDKATFGTACLKYEYAFNRFAAVNATVGYSHSWFREGADPSRAYPKNDNSVMALAGCSSTWFSRGCMSLGSAVSIGADTRIQKNDRGSYTTLGLAGQLDAIDARFTFGKAFLDASVGWGSLGCVRIGAGYRF